MNKLIRIAHFDSAVQKRYQVNNCNVSLLSMHETEPPFSAALPSTLLFHPQYFRIKK